MLRSLEGIENRFANPLSSDLIEFAIKLDNPKSLSKVLNNFQKVFMGLRLKVIDQHYHEAPQAQVIKLPQYIQSVRTACDWMFKNHSLPIDQRLASIAANDSIVVINTNHNCGDSGFILKALKHCLDDDLGFTDHKCPISESAGFKNEIERAEKVKPPIFPYNECTSIVYDKNDPHFDTDNLPPEVIETAIPAEQLACYDFKLKRPKGLTEHIWIATTINLAAMALKTRGKQHLALPIIIDERKFADDPKKIDWSYTNCVTAAHIRACPKDNDTIQDIGKQFRKDLERIGKDGYFYWINNGNFSGNPYHGYAMSSSIGAINIKKPIIDFHIQSRPMCSPEVKISPDMMAGGLNIFSYSLVTPTKNVFYPTMNSIPSTTTQKVKHALHQGFLHFMKDIPVDTKYNEALAELENFQNKIMAEF
ncbi:hypothetical protein TRFO_25165 [Tritrichomonas foetus]|uniref:Uncharacterized protein n=1 Tax=Tritrichomonas foetus TaxID=1144522 RepID=A0A1J4K5G5_9EUKA|nr:hypothetical protein TRFO_25165 [Tritrichomonas foetus]|eukprot:OHT06705.1 hypothetical protein TRFO_25165 [Tritrichomonas foetus]